MAQGAGAGNNIRQSVPRWRLRGQDFTACRSLETGLRVLHALRRGTWKSNGDPGAADRLWRWGRRAESGLLEEAGT